MQNHCTIHAGSVQRLRGAAGSLQNLDRITAGSVQRFERLQDYCKIRAESRQRRGSALSPAETMPERRGSGGAQTRGTGAISSSDAALLHSRIAKPEGPTGARSAQVGGTGAAGIYPSAQPAGLGDGPDPLFWPKARPSAKREGFVLQGVEVLALVAARFSAKPLRRWTQHLLLILLLPVVVQRYNGSRISSRQHGRQGHGSTEVEQAPHSRASWC